MSGPKLGTATIDYEQMRRMEEQRQEALRRERERLRLIAAQKRFAAVKNLAVQLRDGIASSMDNEIAAALKRFAHDADAQRVQQAKREAMGVLDAIIAAQPDDADALSAEAKRAEASMREVKARFMQVQREAAANMQLTGQLTGSVNSAAYEQLTLQMPGETVAVVETGFSTAAYTDAALTASVDALAKRCEARLAQPGTPEALQGAYRLYLQAHETFSAAAETPAARRSITDSVERLKQEESRILAETELMEEAYAQYQSLCALLKREPWPQQAFGGLKQLNDQIDSLNDEYRCADEMDYVADAIEKVMRDLNYTLIKTSTLQADGAKDMSLYRYDADSAVQVFSDSDGSVLMQLALTDPVGDEQRQRALCYEKQLSFCAQHPEITRGLERYGVKLQKIKYAAPSENNLNVVATDKQAGADAHAAHHEGRRVKRGTLTNAVSHMQ